MSEQAFSFAAPLGRIGLTLSKRRLTIEYSANRGPRSVLAHSRGSRRISEQDEMSKHRTFWEWVDRRSPQECWPWLGSLKNTGYGQYGARVREERTAHREAWRRTWGEIPAGLQVCHSCDNKVCCNPGHLWLGTAAANVQDLRNKVAAGLRPREAGRPRRFAAEHIQEMRRRYDDGVTITRLAADFGCPKSVVFNIVHRVSYREVAP